jgi:hypothetical protein
LANPDEMRLFAGNYVDFLSGTAAYQFIAGTQRDPAEVSTVLYRVAAVFVLGCIAYGVYYQAQRGRPGQRTLLLGVAAVTLGLFLIAGPRAVAPHTERYAIVLISSTALLAAIGIAWWVRSLRRMATVSWIVAAWAVLAVFHANYVHVIGSTGGESHRAFRTTSVDPKLAAVRTIVNGSEGDRPVWIIAREWWSYWPTEYFTFTSPRVQVFSVPGNDPFCDREFSELSDRDDGDRLARIQASCVDAVLRDASSPGDMYLIEFAESADVERIEKQLARSGYHTNTTIIRDFAGRPVIVVIRPIRL